MSPSATAAALPIPLIAPCDPVSGWRHEPAPTGAGGASAGAQRV